MLESVLSSLEGLDESLSSHYKEVEGVGYVLDTKPYVTDSVSYGNVDTRNLKNALDVERKNAKSAAGLGEVLESYKALGSVDDLQSKLEQLGNVDLKTDEAISKVTEQYQAKLDALTESHNQMRDKFINSNHSREVTALMNTVVSEIADGAGANAYFEGIIKSMTKINDEGKIVVIDSLGNELTSREPANMGPMTLSELWSTLKTDPVHAFALKPSGASGAGTTGHSGGGASIGAITDAKSWNAASKEQQVSLYNTNPSQAESLARAGAKLI